MVENFFIQIYRRGEQDRVLHGTVERVEDGSRQAFSTVDELWRCLGVAARRRKRQRVDPSVCMSARDPDND
ncbi:MAG: hypothetical protein IT532_05130 [Burkholderiales bacterium]|nr:hypothetical protein [Burkholderiales bacterium]